MLIVIPRKTKKVDEELLKVYINDCQEWGRVTINGYEVSFGVMKIFWN